MNILKIWDLKLGIFLICSYFWPIFSLNVLIKKECMGNVRYSLLLVFPSDCKIFFLNELFVQRKNSFWPFFRIRKIFGNSILKQFFFWKNFGNLLRKKYWKFFRLRIFPFSPLPVFPAFPAFPCFPCFPRFTDICSKTRF